MKTLPPQRSRRHAFAVAKMAGAALFLLSLLCCAPAEADTILASKHDLSAAGPGTIKAATETDVCIFCHTPHGSTGDQPLWNHKVSAAGYTPYSSSTAKAAIGQPTGSSRLCLSCHDGTVALGMVNSRSNPIEMQNGVTTMPMGRTRLGTDLSDDHPVSFTYNSTLAAADGQLKDPASLVGKVRLDHDNQLQCTSCHDPHDNQYGKFLVQNNTASALCLNCHNLNSWITSDHRTSGKTWNGAGVNPWPHTDWKTVSDNACESCHAPHTAGTKERLLNFSDEEQNCFSCHSGTVAARNIQTEFSKASIHPIFNTTGVHQPNEDSINPPRHVECADCHNPHAARTAPAGGAPAASGALAGLVGVNLSGALVNPLTSEYELCYRCHADSVARGPARVSRQFPETNKRLQFSSSSRSYHPVEAVGKNNAVPSLLAPYTTSSLIYCTDCHNNDQGPGAGGTGPNGPHGSIWVPLLERQQTLADNMAEDPSTYALCYKCHNRTSILANQSFPGHSHHIADIKTACTTCHDSHGVANADSLINFNTTYVTASSNSRLEYVKNGAQWTCSLTCHGKDHAALSYPIVGPTTASPLRKRLR